MTETALEASAAPAPRRRLMGVLVVTMIVSAVPLNLMGVLAAVILPDLGISRSQLGFALSTVTGVGGIFSLAAGRITDAVDGRRVLRTSLGLGAMALVLVSTANSYAWLLAAMVLTGLMQSFSNPGTNAVIAVNFPPGGRGLVTGIKQSGVQASLFLCGVALPPIAQAAGWRVAVATLLVLPLAGLVGASVVPREGGRGTTGGVRRGRVRHPGTIRWLAGYSLVGGIGQSSLLAFVPLYANEEVGLSLAVAGTAGAAIGFLGVVSRIAWTQRAERFANMTTPLVIITFGSVAAAASLLLAAGVGGVALWAGVVVAGLTTAASNAVVQLATVTSAPEGTTGRASSLVILFFLLGNTIGPSAFGWLVDRTGHYQAGWSMVLGVFLVALTLLWAWNRSRRQTAP